MNNLLASLMFFTRLPFWRIKKNVPSECFRKVVVYWAFAGWFIGALMVCGYWVSGFFFPGEICWIMAVIVRLFVTGAMHCDGLADFLDGFGGGTSRERILAIMKDSHIGTYGVIGLIFYFVLLLQTGSLTPSILFGVVIVGNTWPRFISSQVINLLPYARPVEDSKAGVVYTRMTVGEWVFNFVTGASALFLLPVSLLPAVITPLAVAVALMLLMKRKIGGYTGDCCGALFTLTELSFYLSVLAIWR